MKKSLALIALFALLPLGMTAQKQSAEEILSWISNHFEVAKDFAVVEFSSQTVDYADEQYATGITYQGCNVAITQVKTDRYSKVETGEPDYTLEQTGTATLDLSKGIPDAVTVGKGSDGQPPAHVILKFAQPIPWHQEQKFSAHPVPQDVVDDFNVKVVEIDFATLDLANQQAKAWQNAIIACGGKSAPDNISAK